MNSVLDRVSSFGLCVSLGFRGSPRLITKRVDGEGLCHAITAKTAMTAVEYSQVSAHTGMLDLLEGL